jgi:hypothetical protein
VRQTLYCIKNKTKQSRLKAVKRREKVVTAQKQNKTNLSKRQKKRQKVIKKFPKAVKKSPQKRLSKKLSKKAVKKSCQKSCQKKLLKKSSKKLSINHQKRTVNNYLLGFKYFFIL